MSNRALLVVVKFLPLEDLLLSAALVSHAFLKAVFSDETFLHFLSVEDAVEDPSLTLYQRVKSITRCPNYLLHVADSKVLIWNISHNTTQAVKCKLFVNSSRYTLLTAKTAVITGGASALKKCTKVDLDTLEITPLKDSIEGRMWHGTANLRRSVYICGGEGKSRAMPSAEVFDGLQWKRVADMTTPRYNLTLSVYKSTLYAFGGSNDSGYQSSIEYFNEVEWHLAPMQLPSPRNYSTVTSYRQQLLLLGGFDPCTSLRFVHVWDEQQRVWREVSALKADYSLSNAVSIRNRVCYFYDHPSHQVQFQLAALSGCCKASF